MGPQGLQSTGGRSGTCKPLQNEKGGPRRALHSSKELSSYQGGGDGGILKGPAGIHSRGEKKVKENVDRKARQDTEVTAQSGWGSQEGGSQAQQATSPNIGLQASSLSTECLTPGLFGSGTASEFSQSENCLGKC